MMAVMQGGLFCQSTDGTPVHRPPGHTVPGSDSAVRFTLRSSLGVLKCLADDVLRFKQFPCIRRLPLSVRSPRGVRLRTRPFVIKSNLQASSFEGRTGHNEKRQLCMQRRRPQAAPHLLRHYLGGPSRFASQCRQVGST